MVTIRENHGKSQRMPLFERAFIWAKQDTCQKGKFSVFVRPHYGLARAEIGPKGLHFLSKWLLHGPKLIKISQNGSEHG